MTFTIPQTGISYCSRSLANKSRLFITVKGVGGVCVRMRAPLTAFHLLAELINIKH